MKKLVAVASSTLCLVAMYILYPRFDIDQKNNLASNSLNQELKCTEPYSPYEQFGTMVITSQDGGKTLSVAANGKSHVLYYFYGFWADVYKNDDGQTLSFDGEIYHDGFFENRSGKCS